jgi:hypothetical protein
MWVPSHRRRPEQATLEGGTSQHRARPREPDGRPCHGREPASDGNDLGGRCTDSKRRTRRWRRPDATLFALFSAASDAATRPCAQNADLPDQVVREPFEPRSPWLVRPDGSVGLAAPNDAPKTARRAVASRAVGVAGTWTVATPPDIGNCSRRCVRERSCRSSRAR